MWVWVWVGCECAAGLFCRSLLPCTVTFDARGYLRYASISRSRVPCDRSLLPYGRSLLTLKAPAYLREATTTIYVG